MRKLAASTVFILVLGFATRVPACGPEIWGPDFGPDNGIDWPETDFVAGHLGVLHATMSRRDQIVAYRVLSDLAIPPREQADLIQGTPGITWEQHAPWVAQWQAETGQKLEMISDVREDNYHLSAPGIYRVSAMGTLQPELGGMFLNCPDDAFHAALTALQVRQARWRNQPELWEEWLAAQKIVFDNCGGPAGAEPYSSSPEPYPPQVPDRLPADRPVAARADRDYQIAAAMFYAGEYEKAAQAFTAIAADPASPWHAAGRYLAARAMVREATVQPDVSIPGYTAGRTAVQDAVKAAQAQRLLWLGRAEEQVDAVLRDPEERTWWNAAEELRGFIEVRLHPRERMLELGRRLMSSDDPTLGQDATDLDYLFDRQSESAFPGSTMPPSSSDDLVDWLQTFPAGAGANEWAYLHDVDRWKASHSMPWLVAALMSAYQSAAYNPTLPRRVPMGVWPNLDELLSAAKNVSPNSPAFTTLRFEQVRIEAATRRAPEAYQQATATSVDGMAVATRNEFLAAEFMTAPTLPDAIAAAPRTTIDGSYVGFDTDSLGFFNGEASVAELTTAASITAGLPERLHDEVLTAAWTRGALLSDTDVYNAQSLQALTKQLTPELAQIIPGAAPDLAAYASATSPEERRFDVAWILLHYPGLSPYVGDRSDYDGDRNIPLDVLVPNGGFNWWYAPLGGYGDAAPSQSQLLRYITDENVALGDLYRNSNLQLPFTVGSRNSGYSELQQLQGMGLATDLLCRWVLEWVSVRPEDARAPEALALAVDATGHHEGDAQTAELSQACFNLLKTRYGNTTWAAKTTQAYKGICGKMGDACP